MEETALQPRPTAISLATRLLPYVFIAILFIALAFYGTAIYNFFIPTVVQRRDFSLGLTMLAIIGGAAAFLSPCAFGMLPAYFAYFLSVDASTARAGSRFTRSLEYGLAAALGMATVAIVLAIAILWLGAAFAPSLRIVTPVPNPYTRALRILIGLLEILLGILQWRGRSLAFWLPGPSGLSAKGRSPLAWFYLYGILYVLCAMPCVANVMAAPLLAALATQGIIGVVVTELLFLSTMSVLMVIVSGIIGSTNEIVLRPLRLATPIMLKFTGAFLVLMGVVLVYLNLNLAAFRATFFHFPIR